MAVEVIIEDTGWASLDLEGLTERAASATFQYLGLPYERYEFAVLAANDAEISRLNREFRGRSTPTNVLSWPANELFSAAPGGTPTPPNPEDPELGDIAIAYETCEREAKESAKPIQDHVTHLVIHALLHLLGFDHEREEDAALMEETETRILAKLGLPDPY